MTDPLPAEQCVWSQCCEGCTGWTSGCGLEFTNGEGSDSITEWMNFCPYCGKEVVIAEPEDETT